MPSGRPRSLPTVSPQVGRARRLSACVAEWCALPFNRKRPLLALGVLLVGGVPASASSGELVMFRSGVGRFEVAAVDGAVAGAVNSMADELWRFLAVPLALPEAFSSPVFVRLIPAAEWSDSAAFRVFVEPGGLVSVRLKWEATPQVATVRRALVQGLLMRLAVTHHGVRANLNAPLWLEHAVVGWWQTRLDGAQLDALKQETASVVAPSLPSLLGWQRGAAESRALAIGATWLLTFFQAESTAGEWPALLRRLLGGDEPLPAVARSFPGRFGSDTEREVWWQTGWHHLRRAHGLPSQGAAESRQAIAELARFVFMTDGERDVVVSLAEVLAQTGEVWLDLDLQRRAADLNRLLPSLHPFYRNAGLSLSAALSPSPASARRADLVRAFEQDWRDALELEAAATAALERLERGLRTSPTGERP